MAHLKESPAIRETLVLPHPGQGDPLERVPPHSSAFWASASSAEGPAMRGPGLGPSSGEGNKAPLLVGRLPCWLRQ